MWKIIFLLTTFSAFYHGALSDEQEESHNIENDGI